MTIPPSVVKFLIKFGVDKVWPKLKTSLSGSNPGEIIPYRKEGNAANVLVLIHGFSGDAKGTFTGLPELLSANPAFKGWDIYSIGYSSDIMPAIGVGIWSAIPDISKVSRYLITTVKYQFGDYKNLAFVAHSMGGLVLQRALLDMDESEFQKISNVMLFGTPSSGLASAGLAKWWNRQLRDMSKDGEFIKKLRTDWTSKFANNYRFNFKSVAGMNDEFVPVESSQSAFDPKYCETIPGNHLYIVKPDSANHLCYTMITELLSGNNGVLSGTAEQLNKIHAEYHDTINRLMPKKEGLDKNGLKDLAFALEGLGRHEEALKVLTDSPLAQTNSDMMGIIGGRYKRKYLRDFLMADGENAFANYAKGLEKATADDRPDQVYYHAINLAFLSLVYKEDTTAMKNYALKALEACGRCPDDLYKIATVAEASLYLGKLEEAKLAYAMAAKFAGDSVQQKSSIADNAYKGYRQLYKTENSNDEFIRFLEQTFA